MELLKIEVRQDWQEQDRQASYASNRLWRATVAVVLVSLIATYCVILARLPYPLEVALRIGFTPALFLAFALGFVYRDHRRGWLGALLVYGLLLGAAFLAAATLPVQAEEAQANWQALRLLSGQALRLLSGQALRLLSGQALRLDPGQSWPVFLALLIIPAGWAAPLWIYRRNPGRMRLIGFHLERWPSNLILGVAAAGSLGLHLLLTTYRWLDWIHIGLPTASLDLVAWVSIYLIGLGSLGEEFFLRGVAFHLLYEETESSFWKAGANIAVLNLLIYILPTYSIAITHSIPWLGVWLLLYRLAFSLMMTFFRQRQGSLILCIAGNFVFNLIMAVIFL